MYKPITTIQDAPPSYPRCFNHQCPRCTACLHYQAAIASPPQQPYGQSVFPHAWQDGECQCFSPAEPQQLAWGFNRLFKPLSDATQHEARTALRNSLSAGMSTYYRYHKGEYLLSPRKQEDILDFMSQFGSRDLFSFDHYVTSYDFNC